MKERILSAKLREQFKLKFQNGGRRILYYYIPYYFRGVLTILSWRTHTIAIE